jgi:NAD(P)-dependent dehydrogenase (short-subunit alcohol dehydrogenase family)
MMAKALAGAGAKKVYILGRRASTLEAAAAAHPSSIRPLVCDVTSKVSLQSAVDTVASEVGHVNLVVANSGVLGPTRSFDSSLSIADLRRRLFDEVSVDEFNEPLHVNITGAYFTIVAFLELLDAGNRNAIEGQGFGKPLNKGSKVPRVQSHVIVTSSIGAFSREVASPPAYAASKSAIAQLAQHAATNLAPYQIRVNTLAPGCQYSFSPYVFSMLPPCPSLRTFAVVFELALILATVTLPAYQRGLSLTVVQMPRVHVGDGCAYF